MTTFFAIVIVSPYALLITLAALSVFRAAKNGDELLQKGLHR